MRHAMIFTLVAGVLAGSGPALGHAFLERATPPVGSSAPVAPSDVVIDFTEAVEPRFSSIEVQDAAGARVDDGTVRAVAGDRRRLVVGVKVVEPGTYTVIWHATSVDTHKTEGRYTFIWRPLGR